MKVITELQQDPLSYTLTRHRAITVAMDHHKHGQYREDSLSAPDRHSITSSDEDDDEDEPNGLLTPVPMAPYCNTNPPATYHDSIASQRANQVSQPRTGRPNLLTIRDHRHLIRTVRLNPRIKYRELLEKTGLSCSKSTAYRALKAYGLTNWLAKKRPLLTPEVAALRLAWCKEREAWTKDQWLKVIWSDECSVERGTGKERA